MTTPVGSIKVDLTIDGSGAPKAVQDALKPALADIQKSGSVAGSGFVKQLSEAVDAGSAGIGSSLAGIGSSATRALASAGLSAGSEFMSGLTSGLGSGVPGISSAVSGVASAFGGVETKAAFAGSAGAAALTGVVAAAVDAGKALYDLGARYDGIYDGIAARTGASDDQMESLSQSVRNVGNSTASALEDIGDVVGRVAQSMQLTGGELETVSKQILDFQRMTGEGIDVGGLKNVLRAFDIDASQTSEVLNKLAAAFQETGVPISSLEQALAAAAPAAKSLGLNLDTTGALLVNFEQAGLSADRTYTALTNAAKVFADNNIDLKTGLADTITQLDGLIDSGNEAAAIDLAGKVFGEKNAQKFVDLIRQGKLNVDDLNSGWDGTNDVIGEADRKTADLAENWKLLKNRVTDIASEWAGPVFDAVNKVLMTATDLLNFDPNRFGPPGKIPGAVDGVPLNPGALPGMLAGPATSNTPGSLADILMPSDIAVPGQVIPPGVTLPTPVQGSGQDILGALDSKAAKEPSTKDRRDQIAAGLDPSLWEVNLDNLPGAVGQPPMQVAVTNLPASSSPFGGGSYSVMPSSLPEGLASSSHLTPLAEQLNRVVSAQFPQLAQTGGIGGWRASDPFPDHPSGRALDIMVGGNTALGDQINQWLQANASQLGVQYTLWNQQTWNPGQAPAGMGDRGSPTANHMDHVHAYVQDGQGQLLPVLSGLGIAQSLSGISAPGSLGDNIYAANGPIMAAPGGGMGYFQTDQQAILRAQQDIQKRAEALEDARRERVILEHDNLATEQELEDARRKERNADWDLQNAKADLAEKERGTFKQAQQPKNLSYKDFAYGDPRRALAGMLGGIGVSGDDLGAILGTAGQPMGQIAGDMAATIGGFPLPGPLGYSGTPTNTSTSPGRLADENNPLFLAQAAGFDVPDFSKAGGGPQDLTVNGGLPNDATGRIYSDTAALVDRTFTNLDTAEKARHDQVMAVLNEVRDRLSQDMLGPVVEESVTGGINGMGSGTSEAIGAAMGNAAAPIIASAVGSASSGSGAAPAITSAAQAAAAATPAAATAVNSGGFHSFDFGEYGAFAPLPIGRGPLGNLYDEGGLWPHGTFGTNLSGAPERVLDPNQTRLFDAGLLGGWNLQPQQQQFAAISSTVGGADVSATVGAEWMGVSQLPIISTIVNLLVAVLLKVIGVQVQARDTLDEISADFREFRGDFQAFDATGRVLNDTSGLVDRTDTSEQAAVDERVRILKQVLEGLLQFLIEKIIVPISKAVANTAINIGSQMVGGAIGGAGNIVPGGSVVSGALGSMVSSAISTAGSASVDIIAEVGTILAESLISVGLDAISELFQSALPDLSSLLFSGEVAASVFDPIGQLVTGAMGGVSSVLGGLFGGLASLIPGLPFDDGGVAVGMGLMPKATLSPERVLSPRQTVAFERLPDALHELVAVLHKSGNTPPSKTVHVPITVTGGGQQAATTIAGHLTSLLG